MPIEAREQNLQFTSAELEQFQNLRRLIYDSQILPAITSKVSWLGSEKRPLKGAELPQTPNQSQELASILYKLGNKLSETIQLAETDPTFGSYYLRLYENFCAPAAPDFHFLKRDLFDRATEGLLTALQGEVPLKAFYSWDEISQIYQSLGKNMPPLPKALIYVGGPDDGVINSTIWVNLPTKAPFMFVDYSYQLWGKFEGSTGEDNPVKSDGSPRSVAIQVVRLDHLYPQYPGQRYM